MTGQAAIMTDRLATTTGPVPTTTDLPATTDQAPTMTAGNTAPATSSIIRAWMGTAPRRLRVTVRALRHKGIMEGHRLRIDRRLRQPLLEMEMTGRRFGGYSGRWTRTVCLPEFILAWCLVMPGVVRMGNWYYCESLELIIVQGADSCPRKSFVLRWSMVIGHPSTRTQCV